MSGMKKASMRGQLFAGVGVLGMLGLALAVFAHSAPLVVLHYAAGGGEPVGFFFNEDNDITKDVIQPGTSRQFRTARRPHAEYFINVSLPLASRDEVEIKPPFSRVDVYIGADTRIKSTAVKTDFLARIGVN
ncbi:hypothetical protein F2P44_06860 [Massilia sp. CCM 8695]|uniref:DUF2846 domain-containing protein n=1 Tax=Massilia frigida TaxID=2609281 RepID=A0ABX0N9A2_9BURK|nr:hypothetical protein [Massilia frigida]NHZ78996.1 hypothetical protein [Massilia frigida]